MRSPPKERSHRRVAMRALGGMQLTADHFNEKADRLGSHSAVGISNGGGYPTEVSGLVRIVPPSVDRCFLQGGGLSNTGGKLREMTERS